MNNCTASSPRQATDLARFAADIPRRTTPTALFEPRQSHCTSVLKPECFHVLKKRASISDMQTEPIATSEPNVNSEQFEDPEPTSLTPAEQEQLSEAEHEIAPVSFQGRDFPVDSLVQRLNNDYIKVPRFGHNDPDISAPGFQRGFVWTKAQMDRFIESLLLGYPVPGIFLVRQEDNRYLVLDGQQRLITLQKFYAGSHNHREFSLENVSDKFKDLTYNSLSLDLRLALDNSYFNATIVEASGPDDMEAIYQIFERLNSGGTPLTPHEIRVALYPGKFIDYLEELNQSSDWRSLYGKESPRIRDQELILRIFALYCDADEYSSPLKSFLNGFARKYRLLNEDKPYILSVGKLFREASKLLYESVGKLALRTGGYSVNAAKTEAIFVGLMKRLASNPELTPESVRKAMAKLDSDNQFFMAIQGSTSNPNAVDIRLARAIKAFADI